MDPAMPPELAEQFQQLHDEFVWLCLRWINFRQLFAVSESLLGK
jgi:hypothetical protein